MAEYEQLYGFRVVHRLPEPRTEDEWRGFAEAIRKILEEQAEDESK